jgi:hypothetical protein
MSDLIVVKNNHLRFGGKDYFRGGAEDITGPGDIGEKKTPLFKMNYLDPKDSLPRGRFTVQSGDIGASISAVIPVSGVPVPTSLDAKDAYTKLKKEEIRLVKFVARTQDLVGAINDSPAKRKELLNWGKDARVVTQVFVAVHHTVWEKYGTDVSVDLSVGVDNVLSASLGGSGSSAGLTTIKFAKRVVFAYMLGAVQWTKNDQADDIDDDQWSLN